MCPKIWQRAAQKRNQDALQGSNVMQIQVTGAKAGMSDEDIWSWDVPKDQYVVGKTGQVSTVVKQAYSAAGEYAIGAVVF